ncbi:hypothetical protein NC653_034312 [Populus alba x Populus x berolinensis]|uniref:Uncharacterized protein n=1 Tax=Populus alba x Populus x berolinensis TaxID=444605 RepID=A0AAD6PVW7_9ROSI|nr:hypothetical protein NC653_034312 [Populus alba x Populus x berolinensis]
MEILWLDRLSYNSLLGTDQERVDQDGQLHDLQGPASTSQLQRDPFPKTEVLLSSAALQMMSQESNLSPRESINSCDHKIRQKYSQGEELVCSQKLWKGFIHASKIVEPLTLSADVCNMDSLLLLLLLLLHLLLLLIIISFQVQTGTA